MPQKLPIAVCLIAKNEAHNIARCLDSVASWTSEIIVVTNDCSDDTAQIAQQQFSATVIDRPWQGYGAQKNFAASQASQPWILSLDCDEEVSAQLASHIQQWFTQENPHTQYIRFPRKTQLMGRWILHGDWYPDICTRLYRQGSAQWSHDPVHEKLQTTGSGEQLAADLLHYSYQELPTLLQKTQRYAQLFAQQKAGKTVTGTTLVGRCLWSFFRCYILKKGFLDGSVGFFLAYHRSYATLYKYALLKESNKQQNKR